MADQTGTNSWPFDVMNPWRGMRDFYLENWAKLAVEMVNSPAYAEATGAFLNNYMTVSAPLNEAVGKYMLKTLEQLSMPSRADVLSIAERLTNVEIRLDDLDAKLDVISRPNDSSHAPQSRSAGINIVGQSPDRAAKRTRKQRK